MSEVGYILLVLYTFHQICLRQYGFKYDTNIDELHSCVTLTPHMGESIILWAIADLCCEAIFTLHLFQTLP